MLRYRRFALVVAVMLCVVPSLLAQQTPTFLQPNIPEDVRRFESYYRAGVWRMSAKEPTELEARVRTALGLPEGAGAPSAGAAASRTASPASGSATTRPGAPWDPAQFRAELQRESQHFAAKMLPLNLSWSNVNKEVKEWHYGEARRCAGEKPDRCLEEAKDKACLRVEDGYQRLHNDWRNLLFDFYQSKLEILTQNDDRLAALNPSSEARELTREWMAKSYEEMTSRFISAWGATLERQWGNYCKVPPASDGAPAGWETALRSPFPAPK